jgi:hypothetical protein
VAKPRRTATGFNIGILHRRSKINQWQAFVRKNPLQVSQYSLEDVVNALQGFLMPPAKAAAQKQAWKANWTPHAGWATSETPEPHN